MGQDDPIAENPTAEETNATQNELSSKNDNPQLAGSQSQMLPKEGADSSGNHDQNLKIVEEYHYLMERSHNSFAGLRDLPPTSGPRHWQPYFQRTFEVYTKLWKFQQINRHILESKEYYGLKRYEIGEIASKIGQLYYHYYLRTSETNYLSESYVFLAAIRERAYFKDVLDQKNVSLMTKKLRYYARFIVVCLLLNKKTNARELVEEMDSTVKEYISNFKPADSQDWINVLQEIVSFLDADKSLVPVDYEGVLLPVNPRSRISVVNDNQPLRLHQALLVGSYSKQIKFSELTLDMFRMLQVLEREPGMNVSDVKANRYQPYKQLLYRPTFGSLMMFIANSFMELADNSILLLYVSADGSASVENAVNGYQGGVLTNVRNSTDEAILNCLHPMDLVPFTRKPFFLIVDSSNSPAYASFPRAFKQPLMCLLSPPQQPSTNKDPCQFGNLFTLFLHEPVLALITISSVSELQKDVWNDAHNQMNSLEQAFNETCSTNSEFDSLARPFLSDDFLAVIIARFLICHCFLKHHTSFKVDPKFLPQSFPVFPDSILNAHEDKAAAIVKLINAGSYFDFK